MRKLLRWLIFPLGLGLLFSTAYFQEGKSFNSAAATSTVAFVPSNRLDEPTLPAVPSQADLGAQDYWFNCMACHGDKGQGLTAEFRQLYPPEDQNCWTSGCHGNHPYANGFTLPTTIPAIVGAGDYKKFGNAAGLFAYINTAMPWHKPGSLDADTYWRLTAFLLRENGIANPYPDLGPSNARLISLGGQETHAAGPRTLLIGLGILVLMLGFGLGIYFRRRS